MSSVLPTLITSFKQACFPCPGFPPVFLTFSAASCNLQVHFLYRGKICKACAVPAAGSVPQLPLRRMCLQLPWGQPPRSRPPPVSVQNQSPVWGSWAACWILRLQFRDSCCLPCSLALCKPLVLAPEEGAAAWVSGTAVAAPEWGTLLQQGGDKFVLGGNETSTVPSARVQTGELVHKGELHGFGEQIWSS